MDLEWQHDGTVPHAGEFAEWGKIRQNNLFGSGHPLVPNPREGQLWFDTDTCRTMVFSGGEWKVIGVTVDPASPPPSNHASGGTVDFNFNHLHVSTGRGWGKEFLRRRVEAAALPVTSDHSPNFVRFA